MITKELHLVLGMMPLFMIPLFVSFTSFCSCTHYLITTKSQDYKTFSNTECVLKCKIKCLNAVVIESSNRETRECKCIAINNSKDVEFNNGNGVDSRKDFQHITESPFVKIEAVSDNYHYVSMLLKEAIATRTRYVGFRVLPDGT